MNPSTKGYKGDHTGDCQKCCLHCLPSSELQATISNLEKENEVLKEEKEEWLEEQRRYIVKLGDYSDEKKQLGVKLKEVEERKRSLMFKLKNVLDEKKMVIKHLEGEPLKVERYPDKQNESSIRLEKVEEKNKLLESQLKRVSEENNRLMKNLEGKSQTIHRFLNEQVKVMKYTDMKTVGKLFRAFHVVRNRMDVCGAEQLNVLQTLQEVQQTCHNCRASFLQERLDYENKIKKLENEQVNDKFLLDQQSNLIIELKQEREKLKKEIKEIHYSKKEKDCNQENHKLCKEKAEILLPPTPDSWSTSQDTISSEDIGFDIQQSNPFDEFLQTTPDSLEIKIKSEHREEVLKTRSKVTKPSKKYSSYVNKDSTNITKANIYDAIRNPIEKPITGRRGRKKKSSFESPSVGIDATDYCCNSNVQEVSAKNLHDKDDVPFKIVVDEPKKDESLEIVSLQESISKRSLCQNSNGIADENILPVLEDVCVCNELTSSSAKKSIASKSIVWNGKRRDYKQDLSILTQKSLNTPVNESALTTTISVESAGGRNSNSYKFAVDDAKSIISSEGWSPLHDLESNDFEPSLNRITQFPAILSPFRLSTAEDSRSNDSNLQESGNCSHSSSIELKRYTNFDSHKRNHKQSKSIFSPILSSSTQCPTTIMPEKKTEESVAESLDPGEIYIETKHPKNQANERENTTSFIPDLRIRKNNKTDGFADTNEFEETKSFRTGIFSRKDSTQKKNVHNVDVNNITENCKNKICEAVHDNQEQENTIGNLEDDIKPLKINSEETYTKLKIINANLVKEIKVGNEINGKPSKWSILEKRVNGCLKDESKDDNSELSKIIYEPLHLSSNKVENGLTCNLPKSDRMCMDDSKSFLNFPCLKKIDEITDNVNQVKMHTEEDHNTETEPSEDIDKLHFQKLQVIKGISGKSEAKQPEVSTNLILNDKVQISPLMAFNPNTSTEVGKHGDSLSPHKKIQANKLSREIKALNNTIFPPDGLFISPQSKHSEVTSQVSVRSPTAMDCYGLRLSPKLSKNFQYCAISPIKNGSHSNKSSKNVSTIGNVKKTTKINGSATSCRRKIVHCSPNSKQCSNQTSSSPRSPDSMKHYNMRPEVPQRMLNCFNSTHCSEVEATSFKIKKVEAPLSSVVHKPLRFKKSTVLPNIASNHMGILSEIKAQSFKDDTHPLEIKLKLTPQERMNKLKDLESLIKPVEINVGYNHSNGVSVTENSKMPTTVQNIEQVEKPCNNGNDDENSEKGNSTNNPHRSSENILESDQTSIPSSVLHRSYSQSGKFSSTNDLLKILEGTLSESLATTVTKLDISVSKEAEGSYIKRSQKTTNNCQQLLEHFSKSSTSNIDVTPLHKMETTVNEEKLFTESDMTYKFISYRSSLFDRKRKHVKDGFDRETSLKKRPLTIEFFKILKSYQRSHINVERITSLNKLKLANRKKHVIKNCYRKSKNTNEVHKVSSSNVIETSKEKEENKKPVTSFSESCSANEDGSNLTEMLLHQNYIIETTKALNATENCESHNLLPSPSDDNNKSEEEADCLVIDIDENLMDLSDADISSSTANQTICAPKCIKDMRPERINIGSSKKKFYQNTIEIKLTDSKSLDFGNVGFDNKRPDTSDHLTSPCIMPNFQPLPEAMCRYKEKLLKTNTDFSCPENRVLPFSVKSDTSPGGQDACSATDVFLPKFYTEHKDSIKDNPVTSSLEQVCQIEEETANVNLSNNYAYKIKVLDDLIPKGVKTKVTENVLRTVINKHKEDLACFIERNISEGRVIDNKVPGDVTEKVLEIVNPLFIEDVKSKTAIVTIVEKLEHYEIRVIVKALMMLLYKLASQAILGNPKASWMLNWDVPQLPNMKSPYVHPKIQTAYLLLNLLIVRFTNEKNEEEKKKFVEEELCFIELAFLGATSEFSDSLPMFWLHLGFLYTLLARQFGFLVRVRQLMYDMLYCFTKRALTVAFAILKAWPTVLRARPIEFYSNDPLTLCIILQLTAVAPEANSRTRSFHFVQPLHDLLWRKYRYRANSVNADELFNLCLQRLDQCGVHEALVLLAKRQPRDWFKQKPLQQLTNVVEEWWKGGDQCSDVRAVIAINALCSSLRAYQSTQIQPEIAKLLNLFKEILSDENTPAWMQEVIVLNTCRLARLNHNQCLDVIINWRPSEISPKVIDQILVELIGKRSPHWWATHQVGRFYLCHR